MILRTTPPRSAFSLVELLVVMFIVLVLLSLSIGALVKGIDWMKTSTTEQTMTKVYTRMEHQLGRIQQESKNWDTPPVVLTLAAGHPKRARVIQHKFLTKWSFPMNFAEVQQNYLDSLAIMNPGGRYPPAARFHQTLLNKDPNYWSVTPAQVPLDIQSAVCLLMSFEAFGSRDELSGNELGTHTYARASDGATVTLQYVQDGWYGPVLLFRWPTGMSSRIATYFPNVATDQDDPEGLLYADDWQQLALSTLGYTVNVPGATTTAMEIEARFHPIRRNNAPSQRFAPLALVSAGALRRYGLLPVQDPVMTYIPGPGNPLYERMSPDATQDELDNLYSFRLKLGTASGN
jgi:prepilin-type N-terminal cleavage/methylation domain-containing protein